MKITKEQQKEMLDVAKPLIKWLNNFHPHIECIVDCTTIRMVEGISTNKTDEYLKD